MADVDARSVATVGDPLSEPAFRNDIEAEAESIEDFEEIWSDITTSMSELKHETDPKKRLAPENLAMAYATKFAFPEKVEVTKEPFSRRGDLDEHVRIHFQTLSDRRDDLRATLGWSDDDVIDAAELVFVDDAVFRFVTVITFEPTDEELQAAQFNLYPEEASEWMETWMEKVDVMWTSLRGGRDLDRTTDEYFRELYESREEFIKKAKERDVFLPITTERTGDPESMKRNIKRRLRRELSSPQAIHEYCYSVVETHS